MFGVFCVRKQCNFIKPQNLYSFFVQSIIQQFGVTAYFVELLNAGNARNGKEDQFFDLILRTACGLQTKMK